MLGELGRGWAVTESDHAEGREPGGHTAWAVATGHGCPSMGSCHSAEGGVSSLSSVFNLPSKGRPSSWSARWCWTFLARIQIGLDWSCGQIQVKPLVVVRRGSGSFQIPSKGVCRHTRMGGLIPVSAEGDRRVLGTLVHVKIYLGWSHMGMAEVLTV